MNINAELKMRDMSNSCQINALGLSQDNLGAASAKSGVDVPGWKLERYLLGELPEEELSAIRAQELSDDSLRNRINTLRGDSDRLLEKYTPERMGRWIKATRANGNGASARPAPVSVNKSNDVWSLKAISRWAILPAVACAAALVLVVLPTGSPDGRQVAVVSTNAMSEDRVKGATLTTPTIEVWRKEGEDARKLAPSDAAREGDIVQLRYVVPESCFGALVSVDGRGVLTVHLSGNDGRAVPLTPGRPVALNASYQLDDAPAFEAFYLITAPEKFDVDSVTRSLKKANHPIDDSNSLTEKSVTAFTLRKSNDEGIN